MIDDEMNKRRDDIRALKQYRDTLRVKAHTLLTELGACEGGKGRKTYQDDRDRATAKCSLMEVQEKILDLKLLIRAARQRRRIAR